MTLHCMTCNVIDCCYDIIIVFCYYDIVIGFFVIVMVPNSALQEDALQLFRIVAESLIPI